jgi:hypothetical protein
MVSVIRDLITAADAWRRFRSYRPIHVTPRLVARWLRQFPSESHPALRKLLDHIQFVSDSDVINQLAALNMSLLQRIQSNGVPPKNVIYASFDEAGSSSPVTLGLLRDKCRLENLGCRFVEANNRLGLYELTSELGQGAIVYVDDFSGSGGQFCSARNLLHETIVGNFSEYLLVHTICEEAITRISKTLAVEHIAYGVHARTQRPLHPHANILTAEERTTLTALCMKVNAKDGLGFGSLATSVIFGRNAPNTTPRVFRGDQNQRKFIGLFPRIKDLPRPQL